MITQLKINSVVAGGYGGRGAAMLDYIYCNLFKAYQLNYYSYITINQIGDDLEEFISDEGRKEIHINVRYPVLNKYEDALPIEKLKGALEMVHFALGKIANFQQKIDVNILGQIRTKILENQFSFDFVHRVFYVSSKINFVKFVF